MRPSHFQWTHIRIYITREFKFKLYTTRAHESSRNSNFEADVLEKGEKRGKMPIHFVISIFELTLAAMSGFKVRNPCWWCLLVSSSVVLLNSSCDCDVPVWLSHSFGPSVPTRARKYLKSRIQSQNIFFLTVIGKDKCLNDLCLHDFVRDLIHDLIQNNTDPRTASDYSKFLK